MTPLAKILGVLGQDYQIMPCVAVETLRHPWWLWRNPVPVYTSHWRWDEHVAYFDLGRVRAAG
jgi:hypothetical protein